MIEKYFKYVAHRLKGREYQLEYRIFTFISKRLFASTEVLGLAPLIEQRKEEKRQGSATINIYAARHLSEFDWQEVQRVLCGANMKAAVQAGDNLFIGPMDPLLRHLGGFKVFREEARLFSEHWLAQIAYAFAEKLWKRKTFYRLFSALHLKQRQPVIVDQILMRDIYVAYLNQLIAVEGRDILMFPEYSKSVDNKTKYGRSYSGRLLDFTPLIFKLLRDINKKTEKKIQIVPVNISYERVVEDQAFRTLEKMKSSKTKKAFTYLVDYFFNYTHWIYQRKKGRVVIKFGEPIPLRKKMDFKMRLHDESRKKVGALQAVFPTQILGYAFRDDRELAEAELLKRVEKTVQELKDRSADLGQVEGMSAQEILQAAYAHFHLHRKRRVLVKNKKSSAYSVMRPDVLSQYGNHIAHLFEKWYDKDQLMKILGAFRDSREDELP